MKKTNKTSWESSSKWYDESVGQKGHYYHEQVILPKLLPLMDFGKILHAKVLDLGCGQGILQREIPKETEYLGVDISKSLIQAAKSRCKNPKHSFIVADLTKRVDFPLKDFTHACILLALQNMSDPFALLMNASRHLIHGGKLFVVLNHPAFRIPRQTHWQIDENKQIQYRRIDRYLSPLQIPIQTHPGKGPESSKTWSFHFPLSFYSKWLYQAGMATLFIEEWISDKKSTGSKAQMEDRAREEIPLFLTFVCQKIL